MRLNGIRGEMRSMILNAAHMMRVLKKPGISYNCYITWTHGSRGEFVRQVHVHTMYTLSVENDRERKRENPIKNVRAVSRLTSFVHGR